MTMKKKNFEDAAFRVQQVEAHLGKHEAEVVCAAFAGFFADDNPRFDAARFEKACKLGANVKAREAGEASESKPKKAKKRAKRRAKRSRKK